MSAIQQINHNMRHLETVNIFLQVAKHPSVLVPRKFSSHPTQTLQTAGCMQPAGPDGVGYKHPLFCECQFLYLHAPLCAYAAPYNLLINMLVGNHARTPYLLHPVLSARLLEGRVRTAFDGDNALSGLAGCCNASGATSGNTKPCLAATDTKVPPVRNFSAFFILPSKLTPFLRSLLVSLGYCLIQLVVTLSKMSLLISS